MQKVKVKIICDKANFGRTCFWDEVKDKYTSDFSFELMHIADILDGKGGKSAECDILELFDRKCTDIIIFNWDSINGDPIYGSDKAFHFFSHYRLDMITWVESGGIIVLEAQTAAWKLVQESYNIFSEKIKANKEREARKEFVLLNQKYLEHPILKDLKNDIIELPEDGLFLKNWFPWQGKICSISVCEESDLTKRRLSQGWFVKYPPDWEPLMLVEVNPNPVIKRLVDDTTSALKFFDPHIPSITKYIRKNFRGIAYYFMTFKKKPVMLCKIVHSNTKVKSVRTYGAYVVTCMYIGSSNLDILVKNILYLPKGLKKYHTTRSKNSIWRFKEKTKYAKYALLFLICFIVMYRIISIITLEKSAEIASVISFIITVFMYKNEVDKKK